MGNAGRDFVRVYEQRIAAYREMQFLAGPTFTPDKLSPVFRYRNYKNRGHGTWKYFRNALRARQFPDRIFHDPIDGRFKSFHTSSN